MSSDTSESVSAHLTAGRDLDAMVAENIMGWTPHVFSNFPAQMQPPDKPERDGIPQVRSVPHYSTDIAAAWEVVEKLQGRIWRIDVPSFGSRSWAVVYRVAHGDFNSAHAESAPLAICLAALKSVPVHPVVDQGGEEKSE